MPWNDTAQLNYLIPEVREAVIQTILHVARKFPIIRFDAAMTLAKRHYHRLWFPEPGSGGDIPSRAEHGLTKDQFDEAFPEEFWRMVVDRVAQEAPDTLLLAEAFWLMEGYFVRTLGMHRVYNSAFMNMMRDEKNQEYRLVIKNTLEFDTEILKRYVNFMNNPDERTAVDQFGKGDKYFGICVVMATLPGLPMIGHGQVEGFVEKYGMEFRYPKWHEDPDPVLVERHQREVFPLLRRRYLFGEVQNFLLYDLYTPEGFVNEDVYAYSNGYGEERALVIYHNRYAQVRGWIRSSAAFAVKTGEGEEKVLEHLTLADGLGIKDDPGSFVLFREHISGMEYIRNSHDLVQQGLFIELGAYKYRVFLDFRQVQDDQDQNYSRLAARLDGAGVSSIDYALREMVLEPILIPFRELVNTGMFTWLIQNRVGTDTFTPDNLKLALGEVEHKYLAVLQAASILLEQKQSIEVDGLPGDSPGELAVLVRKQMDHLLRLALLKESNLNAPVAVRQALTYLFDGPPDKTLPDGKSLSAGLPEVWAVLFSGLFTTPLGSLNGKEDSAERSRAWLDEWLLGRQIVAVLKEMQVEAGAAERNFPLLRVLVGQSGWLSDADPSVIASQLLQAWSQDDDARRYLQIHSHDGVQWFNKECFEELVWWSFAAEIITHRSFEDHAALVMEESVEEAISTPETSLQQPQPPERLAIDNSSLDEVMQVLDLAYAVVRELLIAEQRSGYQLEKLVVG